MTTVRDFLVKLNTANASEGAAIAHLRSELPQEILDYELGNTSPDLPDPPDIPAPPDPPIAKWPVPWRTDKSLGFGLKRGIGLVRVGDSKAPIAFPNKIGKTSLGAWKIINWEWFRFRMEGEKHNHLRERFIFEPGQLVAVYLGGSNYRKLWGKYTYPGPGTGGHGWEVVPGQFAEENGKLIKDSPKLMPGMSLDETPDYAVQPRRIFLLSRLCVTRVPVPVVDLQTLDGKVRWYWNGEDHQVVR